MVYRIKLTIKPMQIIQIEIFRIVRCVRIFAANTPLVLTEGVLAIKDMQVRLLLLLLFIVIIAWQIYSNLYNYCQFYGHKVFLTGDGSVCVTSEPIKNCSKCHPKAECIDDICRCKVVILHSLLFYIFSIWFGYF